jgi:hypothetical protein
MSNLDERAARMLDLVESEGYKALPLLLDDIERRDLRYEYVEALIALLNVPDLHRDVWPRFEDIFTLMSATPEQHCRAFLAVTDRTPNA